MRAPRRSTLSRRLTEALEGHTVEEVARAADVSRETVYRMLRPGVVDRNVRTETIERIAIVCRVRPGWLAFGDDEGEER